MRLRSLGFRLVAWFILLGVLPAGAMAVVAFFEVLRADQRYALGHLGTAAHARAGAVRARLNEYRSQAFLLARHDLPTIIDRLAESRAARSGDASYAVVDGDGSIRAGEATRLTPAQLEVIHGKGQLRIGKRMAVGAPLPDGGAVLVSFPEERVFELLEDPTSLGRSALTYLVDEEGRILGGPRVASHTVERGNRIALPHEAGDYRDFRGVRVLGASATVGPWRVVAEMERSEVVGPLQGLAGRLLGIGAVALVLVMGALLYTGRRIDRSVDAMVASLERAARGEFGVADESSTLIAHAAIREAVDEMHRRLKERDAQIMGQRQQLFCQRCELERLNTEIVQADRMKSEFVANMSHEVRTPLHAILSLSNVLLEETSGGLNEEQQRQVGIIERNGRTLLEMLGDILDFSKIEAGRMSILAEDATPGAILAGVREAVAPLARSKGLELTLDTASDLPTIHTDTEKLHRALLNLAHNAVKFTDEGSVTLQARPAEGGGVAFAVIDTGPGIPRERVSTIFEPFRQLDGSTTRSSGGTGLGLSIALSLVELLGGRIGIESEPGKGTRFTVSLPQAAPVRPLDAPRPVRDRDAVLVVAANLVGGEAVRAELRTAGFRAARAVCGRDLNNALDRGNTRAILLDLATLAGDDLEIVGAMAPRLSAAQAALIGYWLDPALQEGGTPGEMRLSRNGENAWQLECEGAPPLVLPAELSTENRRAAAAWAKALMHRDTSSFHDLMRGLVARLDPALRGPGDELERPVEGEILLLDPDPDTRYSMSLQIEGMGFRVRSAGQLNEVPEGFEAGAVITEARLPDADAPVTALRERTPAPVIVLTADARAETQSAALQAGAAAVLIKPVSSSALLRTLGALPRRAAT